MSTITKEFTKEQLIEQAKKNIEVLRSAVEKIPGSSDAAVIHLKLAEITLASLEAEKSAEPVAFINGAWTLVYYRPPKELGLKIGDKLYAALPAPVSVPDSLLSELLTIAKTAANAADECAHAEFGDDSMEHSTAISDWERRAAMLQGADGNSPVIPDGWVIVPVDMSPEMMRAVQINSELGAYSATNLTGAYSLFREFWDVAIAAAPQQEVK